jgi:hypothetical protein
MERRLMYRRIMTRRSRPYKDRGTAPPTRGGRCQPGRREPSAHFDGRRSPRSQCWLPESPPWEGWSRPAARIRWFAASSFRRHTTRRVRVHAPLLIPAALPPNTFAMVNYNAAPNGVAMCLDDSQQYGPRAFPCNGQSQASGIPDLGDLDCTGWLLPTHAPKRGDRSMPRRQPGLRPTHVRVQRLQLLRQLPVLGDSPAELNTGQLGQQWAAASNEYGPCSRLGFRKSRRL